MKKSELIALLQADLESNGDADEVAIGFTMKKGDKVCRFDVYGDIVVTNDPSYVKGLVCLVGGEVDRIKLGNFVAEELSEEQQAARGSLLAEVFKLHKDSEHKGRFLLQSPWGNKTPTGVYAVAKRLVEEGQ